MGVNNTVGNKLWQPEVKQKPLQENIAPVEQKNQMYDLEELEDLSAQ